MGGDGAESCRDGRGCVQISVAAQLSRLDTVQSRLVKMEMLARSTVVTEDFLMNYYYYCC